MTGLPIVAANSAALPELVRHGENGLLVNPLNANELGEAILSILQHPDKAQQMGQVSLEIGSAHDEQITFQTYEEFYTVTGNSKAGFCGCPSANCYFALFK